MDTISITQILSSDFLVKVLVRLRRVDECCLRESAATSLTSAKGVQPVNNPFQSLVKHEIKKSLVTNYVYVMFAYPMCFMCVLLKSPSSLFSAHVHLKKDK